MTSLSISLLLPISGIVVTAVLVAAASARKKNRDAADAEISKEIDLSWLDEYEGKGKGKKGKGGKQQQKKPKQAKKKSFPASLESFIDHASSSSSSEEEDQHDDIQLLAAIQKNGIKSVKNNSIVKQAAPNFAPAAVTYAEAVEGTDTTWRAVPTKDELLISSLRSRIESMAANLTAANEAKAVAERSFSQAQTKAQRLEIDFQERTQHFSLRLNALEGDLRAERGNASLLAKRLEQLETSELAATRDEASRMAAALSEAVLRVNELNGEREELMRRLSQAEQDVAARAFEMAELKVSVESLQSFKFKYVYLESEHSKVKQALYATEADLIALRSQEASRAAEHKRIAEEAEIQESDLKASVLKLEKQISDFTSAKNDAFESEKRLIVTELDETKSKLATLEESLKGRLEAFSGLEADKQKLAEELFKAETAHDDLYHAHQTALKEAENRLTLIKANLIATEEEAVGVTASKLDEQATKFQADMKTLATELEAAMSDNAELKETIDNLQFEVELVPSLQTRIAELESELSEKSTTVASLESNNREEMETIKQAFGQHLTQSFGLKSRCQQLEQENMNLIGELSSLKATLFKARTSPASTGEKKTAEKKKGPSKAQLAKLQAQVQVQAGGDVTRESSPSPTVASR